MVFSSVGSVFAIDFRCKWNSSVDVCDIDPSTSCSTPESQTKAKLRCYPININDCGKRTFTCASTAPATTERDDYRLNNRNPTSTTPATGSTSPTDCTDVYGHCAVRSQGCFASRELAVEDTDQCVYGNQVCCVPTNSAGVPLVGRPGTFLSEYKLGDNPAESRLWFPHLKSISVLSTLLQSFFKPWEKDKVVDLKNTDVNTARINEHQGFDDATPTYRSLLNNSSLIVGKKAPPPLYNFTEEVDKNIYNDSGLCAIADTRVNAGDNLLGPKIEAKLVYTQRYEYMATPAVDCEDDGTFMSVNAPEKCCSKGTHAGKNDRNQNGWICNSLEKIIEETKGHTVTYTKTPLIEYIYDKLVDGPQSVFKRIMPKDNPKEIKEIPSEFSYTATGGDKLKVAETDTKKPTAYVPHLGSLYDYFLQKMQDAFRPFGFKNKVGSSDDTDTATNCRAELPDLPSVDSSCLSCAGYNYPSNHMKQIFESAASYYKVPAPLLVGVFYNEGGLNPDRGWNDDKVLKSSGLGCKVDNCDSNTSSTGAKGPWQFLQGTWDEYGNAAVEAGVSDGRTTNICNLLDSTFAAAKKLHMERGGAAGYRDPICTGVRLNNALGQSGSCNWTPEDIVTATRQYLGYCEDPLHPDPAFPPRQACINNSLTCYQRNVLNMAQCNF
jgi:hypothetical protein